MKYTKIYIISGTDKKADGTDYIDYYVAENGMAILIAEPINMSGRWYEVYDTVDHAKRSLPGHHEGLLHSYPTLKEAKAYVESMVA